MLTKRLNHRVLCYLMVSIFIFSFLMVFVNPVSASQTLIFNDTDSDTGMIDHAFGVGWDAVRNDSKGHDPLEDNWWIGLRQSGGSYQIARGIFTFDTSFIPDNVTIDSVTLTIHLTNTPLGTCDFYVIDGTNASNDGSIDRWDYNYTYWENAMVYAFANYTGGTQGYKDINFTMNLQNSINTSAISRFYVVQATNDYNNSANTGTDWVEINTDHTTLTVTYSLGAGEENMYDYCYAGDLQQELTVRGGTIKFIEGRYHIRMTNTIKRVDMVLEHRMYNLYSNATDYYMNINGVQYQADAIEIYDCNMIAHEGIDQYLVIWDNVNLEVVNEYVDVAFGIYSEGEWQRFTYTVYSIYDINNDGEHCYRLHRDSDMFGNGVYDGTKNCPYEIAYRLWFTCPSEDLGDLVYDFDDDVVFVSPSSDGDMTFDVGETLHYIVYSSDMSVQPYIHINKNGGNVKTITMNSASVSGHYTPESYGSWNITLYRTVWRDGVNVTVVNRTTNNYIYSVPDVTRTYEQYKIVYLFNSTSNYDGLVVISEYENLNEDWIKSYLITENGTGFFYDSRTSEGNYYIHLCVVYPNNNTYILDSHIHYCWNQRDNEIDVLNKELNLDVPHQPYQSYRYKHNFVGWDVVIKENGEIIDHVGGKAEDTVSHNVYKSGYKNVTLELVTDEGYIILAYTEYTVYGEGDDTGVSDNPLRDMVKEYLDEGQQIILGIVAIFLGALSPSIIAWYYKIKNMPSIMNVLGGVCGFALSLYLELFPMWLLVLFIFLFSCLIFLLLSGSGGVFSVSTGSSGENDAEGEKQSYLKTKIIRVREKRESLKARRKK